MKRTYPFERSDSMLATWGMPPLMRRRTSSHAASASELNFRLSMKNFIRASFSQAGLNRVRKSCSRVIPSSTSYMQDSFLRKHLTHDGLSLKHYRLQKSASLVTIIISLPLLRDNHLDLSFATLTTGRAGHLTSARIVVRDLIGVSICHRA
jgi:hypothetical protein